MKGGFVAQLRYPCILGMRLHLIPKANQVFWRNEFFFCGVTKASHRSFYSTMEGFCIACLFFLLWFTSSVPAVLFLAVKSVHLRHFLRLGNSEGKWRR